MNKLSTIFDGLDKYYDETTASANDYPLSTTTTK